jgi:hypothetical protein
LVADGGDGDNDVDDNGVDGIFMSDPWETATIAYLILNKFTAHCKPPNCCSLKSYRNSVIWNLHPLILLKFMDNALL